MAAWKDPVFSETVPYDTTVADESLRYAADFHMQDVYYLLNAAYNYYDPAVVKASRDTSTGYRGRGDTCRMDTDGVLRGHASFTKDRHGPYFSSRSRVHV